MAKGGQGQSPHITEQKIRGFGAFFATNLKIFISVNERYGNRYRYFHFDCHGGCGFNYQVKVIGSPILFLEIAQQESTPYVLHVAEIHEGRAKELARRVKLAENTFVHYGDNRELVEAIPDLIRAHGENVTHAIGSILLDPNDGQNRSIPWTELEFISRTCPAIDIVFNVPGNTRGLQDTIDIETIPERLQKRHLLIREPIGPWQFTTIIARNLRVSEHKKLGFVDWNSDAGKNHRKKFMLKEKEYEEYCKSGGSKFQQMQFKL